MGPLAGLPKLSRISLFLLVTSLVPTTQASHLFPRAQQVCGGISGLSQCGGDLPASFCCGQDTTCTTVNSTVQAVICCPTGKDCSTIQTVPCDTSQYNATLHPDNQIHFASTAVSLQKCGSACCPLGYTCTSGMCTASKSLPSSTNTPLTASPTTSASSQSSDRATEPLPQPSPSFSGRSFAAGFFPGLILGALATILTTWLLSRRRAAKASRYSGDFGHVARTISDPIYDPLHAHHRTDFIRRGAPSASAASTPQKSIGTRAAGGGGLTPRLKSMWDRTPKLGVGVWSGLPSTPTRDPAIQPPPPALHTDIPSRTHRSSTRRKRSRAKRPHPPHTATETHSDNDSSETIAVLMPAPSFLEPPAAPAMKERRLTADSGHTTFTRLMERAGYGEESRESVRNFGGGAGGMGMGWAK